MPHAVGLQHIEIGRIKEIVVADLNGILEVSRPTPPEPIEVIEKCLGLAVARFQERAKLDEEDAHLIEIGRQRFKKGTLKRIRVKECGVLLPGARP